ncbi:SDR family NAD(P)-dependent oxidoreductase [Micromonospora sp. WMMD1082]|uniref:SDR family NAD(P)-dependent oxidoreductase n=1 Tax=Micromonospora sp. WMMD1082 TaxID=3016104 RepID=UPI002415E9A2|nr:SDR family NAD(P)-dependent oxidoreductase [Micromonospora sp. WMMD1082]MDG4798755.1 SDR family NAD(P)-dependent oxidoreductase [Micromonospora sp. WMMD1082]
MRTVVITGGTRGIGRALADKLRQGGDRVIAIGSADADLTSIRQTAALAARLPDRIDVLILSAGRFDPRRILTSEGFEQTFAIGVLSRYLLAERLRPALERAPAPIIVNLCGTGGIPGGRIHWDDLQLSRGYRMLTAILQGTRANDLLGVGFTAADAQSPIRYVLYNPMFVNSGMHRQFRQPMRTLIGAAAALFGSAPDVPATQLAALLAEPPAAPLTALRRGTPVPLTRPEFDQPTAIRLYQRLADLTAAY